MLKPLLDLASFVYRSGLWLDRMRKDCVILPKPVVSVGNIAVGGRAKTPFVSEICKGLRARGYEPVVLTRGYGRRQRFPYWLIPARLALHEMESTKHPDVTLSGDEALEIFLRAEVPVLVASDRGKEAKKFLGKAPPLRWVFVLDDGFQHWKLERDFDLVLVNESDFGDKVLPAGRLREGPEALDRADLVLVNEKDFRKGTQMKAHPPLGLALGVLTTRARGQTEYLNFFREQFENLQIVELPDHAAKEKVLAAIVRSGAGYWALGLKEATKVLNWRELGEFFSNGHYKRERGELAGVEFYFVDYELNIRDDEKMWNALIEKIRVRELIQ